MDPGIVTNPNVAAFLRAIRLGEGTSDDDGYRRIVGGESFDDYSDHPRKRVWIPRYKLWSTAAGAYQFIAGTWDEMAAKYRLPDFSAHSQDLAAVGLILRRKALDDVLEGRIEQAIGKCRWEWASLPGSPLGQRTEPMVKVLAEYEKHGGRSTPAPIVASTPVFVKEESMSPFIALALPKLIEAIPGLIRTFGKGEVTERNAKAAEAVFEIVREATQTSNAQAAVEAVTNDAQSRKMATVALDEEHWFEATEAGEGGVASARDFNLKAAVIPVHRLPAFWVTLGLLPMVYLVVGAVLFDLGGAAFSGEMKALVIGGIMSGVLAAITAFWLGMMGRAQSQSPAQ